MEYDLPGYIFRMVIHMGHKMGMAHPSIHNPLSDHNQTPLFLSYINIELILEIFFDNRCNMKSIFAQMSPDHPL